jgi:hypothetical protein
MTQPDYGTDLSCVFDLDPMGAMVTGRTLLSQALIRRISTPRGRLLDDPNYGFDVTDALGDDVTAADVAQIGSGMDSEFLKDERVVSSVTVVTFARGILNTTSTITDGTGPFSLVLSIDKVTGQILQAGQAP